MTGKQKEACYLAVEQTAEEYKDRHGEYPQEIYVMAESKLRSQAKEFVSKIKLSDNKRVKANQIRVIKNLGFTTLGALISVIIMAVLS